LSVVLPSLRNHICKCGCSKPELSTNALRLPLSFWNAICQRIDAQEEDGMNQGTEPTSKKKQKKEGLKHTTQIEDLSCSSKNAR
jgi:hypothetical protein